VVGVWVGNDDNTPNPGLSGGGIPARIWRDFMTGALNIAPPAPPVRDEEVDTPGEGDPVGDLIDNAVDPVAEQLDQFGIDLRRGEDGSISIGPGPRDRAPRGRRDEEEPVDERGDEGGGPG
jgi:penicillin-binding protein 1A